MAVRKNIVFWMIVTFVSALQLYFFKCNSGLDKSLPVLSRINNTDIDHGGYEIMYLALLAPVIVLVFYFVEWKSFYVDSYGILQITRSVDIRKYMAKIFGKISLQAFFYTGIIVLLNYIWDYQYANDNIKKVVGLLADYYIAVVDVCALVFTLSLFLRRQLAATISVVSMICVVFISNVDKTKSLNKLLFFNHIVKYPGCNSASEYLLHVGIGIGWIIGLYIISVVTLKSKEFLWREA